MTATRVEPGPVVTEVAGEGRDERHARLALGVRSLRSRAGRPGDRDRYLLIGGSVLVPLGLLLILLGWFGTSRTVLVFEQLAYIASGGLIGLGLVVAGGFLYWSYWLTLLVRERRTDRDELTAGLLRLETLLERALAAAPAAAAVVVEPPVELVATPRGSMLHRPDCPTVASRDGLRRVSADAPGMVPCRLCDPLAP